MNKLNKKIIRFIRENQDKLQEAKFDLQKEIDEYKRNMSKLEKLEEWLEKYPKLESIYDFFKYRIYRRIIEDNYYNTKWFLQKLFTGYNDLDRWNAYVAIAKYSLPLIKWTRENKMGTPCRLTEKQWNNILDKIIYSLEQCIDDTDEPCYNTKLKGDKLTEEIKKYEKKVHKGLKLFGNYFRAIWD